MGDKAQKPTKYSPEKRAKEGWSFAEQVGYNQACDDWEAYLTELDKCYPKRFGVEQDELPDSEIINADYFDEHKKQKMTVEARESNAYSFGFNNGLAEAEPIIAKLKQRIMEQCVENLKDKRDKFIGSLKDDKTIANSDGFRDGLSWAIDSIETHIRLANCEAQGEGE